MKIPDDLKVSISGIRGVVGETFTQEIVEAFTFSYEAVVGPGLVVVGFDGRASGKEFLNVVAHVLEAQGRDVVNVGLCPLPTMQIAVREFGAVAGVLVTASHNPSEYNGLKFLNSAGEFISARDLERITENITQFVHTSSPKSVQSSLRNLRSKEQERAYKAHLEKLTPLVASGKKLRVAVDAVNGAGSLLIPQLLESIGCEVIKLACDPEENFPHVPEPTPANLAWTQERLKEVSEYDLCVVVDPDADRLVLIDEQGEILNEEMTLPLVLKSVAREEVSGVVVVNLSTSMRSDLVAQEFGGVKVVRSKVGEIHVVEKMKAEGAFLGGEGNGGVIDPRVTYGRDSLGGTAHIINLMRRTNKKLSELSRELPHIYMQKEKCTINRTFEELIPRLKQEFSDAEEVNEEDGVRFNWSDAWIHIRPSNTEPVVRIIAESTGEDETQSLIFRTQNIL